MEAPEEARIRESPNMTTEHTKKEMINQELYSKIHSLLPILCIDILIHIDGAFLAVLRTVEPMKHMWSLPGGRLFRDESIPQAIRRICSEEVGLDILEAEFLGYENTVFDADPFGHGEGTHTVNLVFTAKAMDKKIRERRTDGRRECTPSEVIGIRGRGRKEFRSTVLISYGWLFT